MVKVRGGGFVFVMLFLLVIAGLWMIVGPGISAALATQAVASKHAIDSHAEAEAIISCINKSGPAQTLKDPYDPNKFFLTCQLPDGRWGVAPFVKQNGKLYNKTAFTPGDGALSDLWDYLHGKNATMYKGPLPPFGD